MAVFTTKFRVTVEPGVVEADESPSVTPWQKATADTNGNRTKSRSRPCNPRFIKTKWAMGSQITRSPSVLAKLDYINGNGMNIFDKPSIYNSFQLLEVWWKSA